MALTETVTLFHIDFPRELLRLSAFFFALSMLDVSTGFFFVAEIFLFKVLTFLSAATISLSSRFFSFVAVISRFNLSTLLIALSISFGLTFFVLVSSIFLFVRRSEEHTSELQSRVN